jgi:hypothetical protein
MPAADRLTLDLLKRELDFLGRGGYSRSSLLPWRAPLIFEDSPICKSSYCEKSAHPCGNCLLLQFVPPEMRELKVACRYIPLTAQGDNLDSFYRSAYEPEIEEAVGHWLESKINLLESAFESSRELANGSCEEN